MVNHLHRSESQTQCLRLLHQPKVPRLLLPVLQGRPACQIDELASQGHSERIRVTSNTIPEYAGSLQWVQIAFRQYAKWGEEVRKRAIGVRKCTIRSSWEQALQRQQGEQAFRCSCSCRYESILGIVIASAKSQAESAWFNICGESFPPLK